MLLNDAKNIPPSSSKRDEDQIWNFKWEPQFFIAVTDSTKKYDVHMKPFYFNIFRSEGISRDIP